VLGILEKILNTNFLFHRDRKQHIPTTTTKTICYFEKIVISKTADELRAVNTQITASYFGMKLLRWKKKTLPPQV
jgi:hypothetical protein